MQEFENLHQKAHQAGLDAVKELTVVPMVVGEETYPFSGKLDTSKPMEYIADGVCGFAWINIKPATSKFARWLKNQKIADTDSYYGGITIWVGDFNQSYQKKMEYARAYAEVLNAAAYNARAMGRLD